MSVSSQSFGIPDNALPIGSTVHIRTMGRRKPAVPHTIESYSMGADGVWSFKARDFAGWTHIDTVDTLSS